MKHESQYRPPNPSSSSLEDLVARTSAQFGISAHELALPSKARMLSRARAQITREALERGIATLAQVARRLNRSPSSLCELIQRHPGGV